jgi:hypothetical protein
MFWRRMGKTRSVGTTICDINTSAGDEVSALK